MARVVSRRKQREKRIRLRVAASLMDFLGVIGCVALIFLCVTLFRSLFEWINGDFEASFSRLEETVRSAVFITGQ